jgi:type I restriction enzyme M protein
LFPNPASDFISSLSQTKRKITKKGLANSSAKLLPPNSIIVSTRATIGRVAINSEELATNQGFKNIIIVDPNLADPRFIAYMVKNLTPEMEAVATGGTFKELSKTAFCRLQIPLPPIDIQHKIIDAVEFEEEAIQTAKANILMYKKNISEKLGEIWAE